MKIVAFASAALVSFAALTGAASAAGIVPGSDHFTEARADCEANTVIVGAKQAPGLIANTGATQAYGYPTTGSEDGIIPGSRTTTHAQETRDLNAVSRGTFHGGTVTVPVTNNNYVPGSGSF